jgi:hypothetical protein
MMKINTYSSKTWNFRNITFETHATLNAWLKFNCQGTILYSNLKLKPPQGKK